MAARITLLQNLESGTERLAKERRAPRVVDQNDAFDFANAAGAKEPLLIWPDYNARDDIATG
jgi:hypothetical protein